MSFSEKSSIRTRSPNYRPLETEDPEVPPSRSDVRDLHERLYEDPRFNPPTPSIWKRVALILLVVVLFLFAVSVRARMNRPQVIYAHRYSNEHKYRPAASPIITEMLRDGRTRLRGALPTGR